jgi:hypothetical protein
MNKTFASFIDRPFVVPTIIAGVALFGGLWVLGSSIANRGGDSTIVVTGSAIQSVKSDSGTWLVDVRRTAYAGGTAAAYAQVARDTAIIQAYFQSQKLASSSVTASVISTDEDYRADQNAPQTYTVHESVTVETIDVEKLDKISRELGDVSSRVSSDTRIVPQQPAYFISSLPQLRISLGGKAIQDARARAEEIAKNGNTSVGALKSAASGVVQVLAPNSTNVEDYGSYDTSTIQKQVMVTTRATFYVQ